MSQASSDNKDGLSELVPRLKDQGYLPDQVTRRRNWVESRTGTSLRSVGTSCIPTPEMRGNIENPVGAAQIPIGVAGPIWIRGLHAQGKFYIPMATTEGALVRSYERGMVALTRSGGVETTISLDENQTNPSFFFDTLAEASSFQVWIGKHFSKIQEIANSTTGHGRLLSFHCHQIATQVILNLRFSTGDAQGMNMIVKATDAACRWIQSERGPIRFHLFSGMSSEKRPSGYLLSRGKGKWVCASAVLPNDIVRAYLNCSADELFNVWHSTLVGHLTANTVGYNGQFANGLAAIFIATGQDVANIVNSACGMTIFKLVSNGIRVELTLPALTVATVGGGTALPTQKECLQMLGCYGSGMAGKLAEIIAAGLLGGEISMAAAIASGDFAQAHEQYGRNRPKGENPE